MVDLEGINLDIRPGKTVVLPEDDMIETVEATEHLSVDLTEDQKKEFGQKLAQLIEEIERQTGQLKFLSTEIKSKIQAAEAQMRDYANKLRAGYEILPVRVEVIRDYRKGTISYRRTDTGDVYSSRPMTTIEKQRVLFPKEGKDNVAGQGDDGEVGGGSEGEEIAQSPE